MGLFLPFPPLPRPVDVVHLTPVLPTVVDTIAVHFIRDSCGVLSSSLGVLQLTFNPLASPPDLYL
jgi:hypothetical protein